MIFDRRRPVIINVAGPAVRKILWPPDQEKFFLLTSPFIEHSGHCASAIAPDCMRRTDAVRRIVQNALVDLGLAIDPLFAFLLQ
jgi:hypothetical protein